MPEFHLRIVDGKVHNHETVKQAFRLLADGSYQVKIDQRKKRTLPQNAYYWAVVVPLVFAGLQEAGFDTVRYEQHAHEIMKNLFLKRTFSTVDKLTGEIKELDFIQSTSKLKTVEFNIYLEQIWQWAAEYLGIQIPMPNEQMEMFKTA